MEKIFKSFLICLAIVCCFGQPHAAHASWLSVTFTNALNQPDTNAVKIFTLDPYTPVDANGTVHTFGGLPAVWYPDTNGVVGGWLPMGSYWLTNSVLGRGLVYYIPDNSSNQTALLRSGYNTYWLNIVSNITLATLTNAGAVMPDGTSITIDTNGVIHAVGSGSVGSNILANVYSTNNTAAVDAHVITIADTNGAAAAAQQAAQAAMTNYVSGYTNQVTAAAVNAAVPWIVTNLPPSNGSNDQAWLQPILTNQYQVINLYPGSEYCVSNLYLTNHLYFNGRGISGFLQLKGATNALVDGAGGGSNIDQYFDSCRFIGAGISNYNSAGIIPMPLNHPEIYPNSWGYSVGSCIGLRLNSGGGGFVKNCFFQGFNNSGLLLFNPWGTGAYANGTNTVVSGNVFMNNYIGIYLNGGFWNGLPSYGYFPSSFAGNSAEYVRLNQNQFVNCGIAGLLPAGNATVMGWTSTSNYVGIAGNVGANAQHGQWADIQINHCNWIADIEGGLATFDGLTAFSDSHPIFVHDGAGAIIKNAVWDSLPNLCIVSNAYTANVSYATFQNSYSANNTGIGISWTNLVNLTSSNTFAWLANNFDIIGDNDGTFSQGLLFITNSTSTGVGVATYQGINATNIFGNLNANQLTGIIPTLNLGSGTASSSTYLRGDQTWATIAAGGVGNVLSNTAVQFSSVNSTNAGTTNQFAGTVTANGINVTNNLNWGGTATGNGSGITSLTGANVTGTVPLATSAGSITGVLGYTNLPALVITNLNASGTVSGSIVGGTLNLTGAGGGTSSGSTNNLIIFDDKFSSDVDMPRAAALLAFAQQRGDCTVIAAGTSIINTQPAAMRMDATLENYNIFAPIGASTNTLHDNDSDILSGLTALNYTFTSSSQANEVTGLYRRALQQAYNTGNKVTMIFVGGLENLYDLMNSGIDQNSFYTGSFLVSNVVKQIVVMGGDYPTGYEYNFYTGMQAGNPATTVTTNIPPNVPVIYAGFTLGNGISTFASGSIWNTAISASSPIGLTLTAQSGTAARPAWNENAVEYAIYGTNLFGTNVFTLTYGTNNIQPSGALAGSNYWTTGVSQQAYLGFRDANSPTILSNWYNSAECFVRASTFKTATFNVPASAIIVTNHGRAYLQIIGTSGSFSGLYLAQAGETQSRIGLEEDTDSPGIALGPGGSTALDTWLKRSSAGEFEVDNGSVGSYANLQAKNLIANGTLQGILTGPTNSVLPSNTTTPVGWVNYTNSATGKVLKLPVYQ